MLHGPGELQGLTGCEGRVPREKQQGQGRLQMGSPSQNQGWGSQLGTRWVCRMQGSSTNTNGLGRRRSCFSLTLALKVTTYLGTSAQRKLGVELLSRTEYQFAGNIQDCIITGTRTRGDGPVHFSLAQGINCLGFCFFLSAMWKVCHGCTRFFFEFERSPGSSRPTAVRTNPLVRDGVPGPHLQVPTRAGGAQGSAFSSAPQLRPRQPTRAGETLN